MNLENKNTFKAPIRCCLNFFHRATLLPDVRGFGRHRDRPGSEVPEVVGHPLLDLFPSDGGPGGRWSCQLFLRRVQTSLSF